MASSHTADRTRDEPNSEKARTIVDTARELGGEATNTEVADEVELRIGDRPDPSWVSRVRSKYVDGVDSKPPDATHAAFEGEGPSVGPEELAMRIDALAGRLERYTDRVDAVDQAVTELERRVDDIEGDVEVVDELGRLLRRDER